MVIVVVRCMVDVCCCVACRILFGVGCVRCCPVLVARCLTFVVRCLLFVVRCSLFVDVVC